VHGLSAEFLANKPLFGAVANEFLAFVGDAPLVAHNADFGIAFAELKRAAKPLIATERVIDTLALARRKHPGGLRAQLDYQSVVRNGPQGSVSDALSVSSVRRAPGSATGEIR
jgi:DNA polymerase III epsilon subunit-like protein